MHWLSYFQDVVFQTCRIKDCSLLNGDQEWYHKFTYNFSIDVCYTHDKMTMKESYETVCTVLYWIYWFFPYIWDSISVNQYDIAECGLERSDFKPVSWIRTFSIKSLKCHSAFSSHHTWVYGELYGDHE